MQKMMPISKSNSPGKWGKPSKDTRSDCKVVAHLGPHKTGTTSFQHFLESNEGKVNESGYQLITVRSRLGGAYRQWRAAYTRRVHGYMLGRMQKEDLEHELCGLFLQLKEVVAGNENFFLSDENILGPMPGHYFANKTGRERGFYSVGKLVMRVFSETFSGSIEKVVFVKRDVREFLVSAYRDFVAKLYSDEDFDQFIAAVSPGFSQEFDELYGEFSWVFGEKAKVFEFLEFVKSPHEVGREIIGRGDWDSKGALIKNDSMNWRAVDLAVAIAPLLMNDVERAAFSRVLKRKIKGHESEIRRQVERFLASEQPW